MPDVFIDGKVQVDPVLTQAGNINRDNNVFLPWLLYKDAIISLYLYLYLSTFGHVPFLASLSTWDYVGKKHFSRAHTVHS